MKSGHVQIILNAVIISCPLCKFQCKKKSNYFKCRGRYTLRQHLHKEHTEAEVEKYANKIL